LIPTIAKSNDLLPMATNLLRPPLSELKKQQQRTSRRPHPEAYNLTGDTGAKKGTKRPQHTKRTPQNNTSAFSTPINTQCSDSNEFLVTGKFAGNKNFGGSRKCQVPTASNKKP